MQYCTEKYGFYTVALIQIIERTLKSNACRQGADSSCSLSLSPSSRALKATAAARFPPALKPAVHEKHCQLLSTIVHYGVATGPVTLIPNNQMKS